MTTPKVMHAPNLKTRYTKEIIPALSKKFNIKNTHAVPRLEKIVECRLFGGMTARETAEVLDTSQRTVERDWTRAKAYLYKSLHDGSGD